MTRSEAKARAEEIVYAWCTLGDIIARCEILGIPTQTNRGKLRSRSDLEQDLIKRYTEEYGNDGE